VQEGAGRQAVKILHLLYESKGDYFGIGGVGTRAYEIYGRLKDRHEITLLCKRYPGSADRDIEGLRHIFVGAESRSLTKTFLSYASSATGYVRQEGEKFDVIIEEFSPAIPTFLNFYRKRPVVLQVQGYTGHLYFRKYNPVYSSALFLLEHLRPLLYSHFIFISEETAGRLSISHSKHKAVIPNGVDAELFAVPLKKGDYILYLGRIDIYSKGLDLLISAYNESYRSCPDLKLVIAGDGRDMEELRSVVMRLPEGVRENIELPGWVSGARKYEVIGQASFVVFPSRHEVQPISILEALACGKAVVVSDVPECSFVIENRAGLSFRSGDPASLAVCIKSLATNEAIEEMGRNGREWVRGFTWDRIAGQYEKFLLSVTERR
jgi:glycosyltransferase involved in cell wall biosynthesis